MLLKVLIELPLKDTVGALGDGVELLLVDPKTGAVLEGEATGELVHEGALVAAGGRVLNVTALGKTVKAAKKRAYEAFDLIDWPEGFCRRDIGWRAAGG